MPVFNGVETPSDGRLSASVTVRVEVPKNHHHPVSSRVTVRVLTSERASQRFFDAAVAKAYGGEKRIVGTKYLRARRPISALVSGSKGTLDAIQHFAIAIKGPLTTPVGGGIRSLNVTLRQVLNLYACVRPVRYFKAYRRRSRALSLLTLSSSVRTLKMSTPASISGRVQDRAAAHRLPPRVLGTRLKADRHWHQTNFSDGDQEPCPPRDHTLRRSPWRR
jgi:hypothetical protein